MEKPIALYIAIYEIPYTVEVTNKFKGLDLVDRMPEELQMKVHDII